MNGNKTIIWVVLIVIAVAVILFFLIRREPVQETTDTANQIATTTVQTADRAAARAEAAADLTALRVRQEAGESYESLRNDYAEVRSRLAASYEDAEGAAQQEWAELSEEFDEFEASVRVGASNSLDLLTRLIASLSADIRTETTTE